MPSKSSSGGDFSLEDDQDTFAADDDDLTKVCVGQNGDLLDKSLFMFKVLVYDT